MAGVAPEKPNDDDILPEIDVLMFEFVCSLMK